MLQYLRMYQSTFRQTARGALAFLVIVPNIVAAGTLRQEAASYRARGYEAQRRGDNAEALADYQKAAALDPYYLDPHANLGMLYERVGQKTKAIDHWMKRYQLGSSSDPWTIRAKERLTALGALPASPPPDVAQPGSPSTTNAATRRHVAEQELQSHAQSLKGYRSVTEAQGEWP